jgi:cyclic-di-GMP-binding biofilm dispersal mediator protein
VLDVVRSRGALDVLVVNSGVIVLGDARTLDPDVVDHRIDVNVRAPYTRQSRPRSG